MALPETKITDISGLNKRISNLKTQAGSYQSKLNSSPSALGGSGTPTTYDISNQVSLERVQGEIQSLQDNINRARWYPPKDQNTVADEGSPGVLGSTLNFLAKPLYGVVGATKHAIGQGRGSLYQDIADNMQRNRNTFSDVLKTSGIHSGVAAPLGFALDIAFDPLNWATAGGAALIPRLGIGAYKGLATGEGIARGFSSAAKSGVLQKATTVARFTPYLRGSEAFKKLGQKSIAATKDWENFSGTTAADLVLKRGAGIGPYRGLIENGLNKVADAVPGGRTVLGALWYSPKDWIRTAHIKDVFQKHLGADVDIEKAIVAYRKGPEEFASFMSEAKTIAAGKIKSAIPETKAAPFNSIVDSSVDLIPNQQVDLFTGKIAGEGMEAKFIDPKTIARADDAYGQAMFPKDVEVGNHIEKALQMTNEEIGGALITIQDMEKIVKSGAMDETGVKWFDNFMKWNRSWEKEVGTNAHKITLRGKVVMEAYDLAMGLFRVSKVAASVAAYPFAVMGNMAMTHLANGDIGPGFFATLKASAGFYLDRPGAAGQIQKLLKSRPDLIPFLDEYLTASKATFGTTNFRNAEANADKLFKEFVKANKLPDGTTKEMLMGPLRDSINELTAAGITKDQMTDLTSMRKALSKSTPSEGGTSMIREAMAGGTDAINSLDRGAGMMGNELYNSKKVAEVSLHIEEMAKKNPGNYGWKFANFIINTSPSLYDKVDQSFKLATFLRATTHGYTSAQLRQMRHLVEISPEELALWKYENAAEGQTLYRLSPKTALELANVMYLNYNAMPSAVRVMRNMPLLGNPFVSFMYGMTLKTGQALAYNPAAFNKVTFAMNDFGGTKSPLEKKAMDDPGGYYSYLKQPGMFRLPNLPFFGKNPTYLNLANAIPYYSLSMFGVSQVGSGNTAREVIAKSIQRSPFFKEPFGSNFFDYMVLPIILGETVQPKGQFGQQLYPMDAGLGKKALYGTRALAESFTPNVMAYAGLVTPEAAAPYLPLYRWRDLTNAMAGKNQLGITRKEPPLNQTFRSLLKASGIPVQAPINTSFVK